MTDRDEITALLLDLRSGDSEAADRLYSAVYRELRRLAHRQLLGERPGHTLGTTGRPQVEPRRWTLSPAAVPARSLRDRVPERSGVARDSRFPGDDGDQLRRLAEQLDRCQVNRVEGANGLDGEGAAGSHQNCTVTEAFRIDLAQSPLLRVLAAADSNDRALRRSRPAEPVLAEVRERVRR